MDEGLVFWVILFAVAVLQGIGRKKRKPGQPGQKPPGLAHTRPTPPQAREQITASSRPTQASSRPSQDDGEDESSEGLIPQDVWAEILGLARGEPRQTGPESPPPSSQAIPESREERPREEPLREEPSREERQVASVAPREEPVRVSSRQFPSSHGANAVLHQSKPGDYESRLAVSRPDSKGLGKGETKGVRAELFGSGSPGDLRKAIILSEVLGPPHGLKEEGR